MIRFAIHVKLIMDAFCYGLSKVDVGSCKLGGKEVSKVEHLELESARFRQVWTECLA